jgi:hypothetical protein
VFIVLIGVWPRPFLDRIEPSVQKVVTSLGGSGGLPPSEAVSR